MDEIRSWLDAREPMAPPALRAEIDAALERTAATHAASPGIASALGEAALSSLARAIERCDERASAIDLLAADALMTYAMEAAAEQGGETIDAVSRAYGGHRLAALIQETA